MKDLIERLEKATGPGRSLNLAIAEAVKGPPPEGFKVWPICENYTASLDAALTLVPESRWLVGAGAPYTSPWANVRCGEDDTIHVYAATPAIALCIAALKARDFAERDLTQAELTR